MANTWIIVADSGKARIFAVPNAVSPLKEIETMINPAARQGGRELASDRPGRSFDSGGHGRHAMAMSVDPKEHELNEFAREVSDRIETGRVGGDFKKLILVAAPHFLGALRKNLKSASQKTIVAEVDKNVARLSPEQIRKSLPERF